MTHNIIIYSNNKYQILQYYTQKDSHTNTKPYTLLDIHDETGKLQSILPKSIKSYYDSHFIVDINNNCHYVFFKKGGLLLHKIYSSMCQLSFDKLKIVGHYTEYHGNNHVCYTLKKNMEDNCSDTYEYLKFVENNCDRNYMMVFGGLFNNGATMRYKQILYRFGDHMIHNSHSITVNYARDSIKFETFDYGCKINDINYDGIDDVYYVVTPNKNKLFKYKCEFYVHIRRNPIYGFMLDNNNVANIKRYNGYRKICKMANNSVLFHNGHHITIFDNNHITIIIDHDNIIQFMLPNQHIQHIGNTKIASILWSKQLYNKLPNHYQDIIRTIMLCNKTMNQYKIPYCVLHNILNDITSNFL